MRKKTIIFSVVLLLAVSMIILGRVGITKSIEKTVNVAVLTNGSTNAIPSTITIDGTLKKTFFPISSSFDGTFAIEYIERTCSAESKALISWSSKGASFAIMDTETFSLIPVNSIDIDSEMDKIKIVLGDSTVIKSK